MSMSGSGGGGIAAYAWNNRDEEFLTKLNNDSHFAQESHEVQKECVKSLTSVIDEEGNVLNMSGARVPLDKKTKLPQKDLYVGSGGMSVVWESWLNPKEVDWRTMWFNFRVQDVYEEDGRKLAEHEAVVMQVRKELEGLSDTEVKSKSRDRLERENFIFEKGHYVGVMRTTLKPILDFDTGKPLREMRAGQYLLGLVRKNLAGFIMATEAGGRPVYWGRLVRPTFQWMDLTIPERIRIVRDIALAVKTLHDREVYHRDIKPHNCLIDKNKRGLLTDFGLITSAGMIHHAEAVTKTGTAIGTPLYMAPEQFKGDKANVRTDMFGLGGLLYYALSGRDPVPFEYGVDDWNEVVYRAMNRGDHPPVDPALFIDHMDEESRPFLTGLIEMAAANLHMEPGKRYPSARVFIHDMEEVIHQGVPLYLRPWNDPHRGEKRRRESFAFPSDPVPSSPSSDSSVSVEDVELLRTRITKSQIVQSGYGKVFCAGASLVALGGGAALYHNFDTVVDTVKALLGQ